MTETKTTTRLSGKRLIAYRNRQAGIMIEQTEVMKHAAMRLGFERKYRAKANRDLRAAAMKYAEAFQRHWDTIGQKVVEVQNA